MPRVLVNVIFLCAALLVPFENYGSSTAVPSEIGKFGFTPEQRTLADKIVSVFENSTSKLQYSYAKKLHDGRGITAGRAGFTSATGDMLVVIEKYTGKAPGNGLAPYIPRLKKLARKWSSSTRGLDGLMVEWQIAAADPAFRYAQDVVVDELYYRRAVDYIQKIGSQHPLTLLLIYDALLQHGYGEDKDGLPELIKCTNEQLSGSPAEGINEVVWAKAFLNIRRRVLLNPHNKKTQVVWAESVGRVDALMKLVNDGNTELQGPVTINPWGEEFILTSNID